MKIKATVYKVLHIFIACAFSEKGTAYKLFTPTTDALERWMNMWDINAVFNPRDAVRGILVLLANIPISEIPDHSSHMSKFHKEIHRTTTTSVIFQ